MTGTAENKIDIFTFQRAKLLQQYCGDIFYNYENDNQFLCVLADGLGSGHEAHVAAKAVIDTVKKEPEEDLVLMMEHCNQAISGLRGAAVAIIRADFDTKKLSYVGLGNIRFYMVDNHAKLSFPLSTTGFLSGKRQHFKQKVLEFKPGSKFLIHSDGLVLKKVKNYLTSSLCVVKTGHTIERLIPDIPMDDVTFVIGKFPE
ncbi:PP2C family serine/threonine-protein phosphatase [Listeria fleischmannii]|uniref:SpoIIE family protein phosphatase n=1 Tax=Listeria fleischmannii TaxID=1069827 RepID=A0A841YF80_9LIST|nr:PP2C family serine/threonine-protein phosphatase [Listeria fleischmannii]EIA19760.1 serine phosphatase [Listeria fleischmannii subsp. coloradonensis]MBC1398931.1 SpoIIE family protein phosphatase [Listeria fleischmannii]STY34017.1 Stage II sporulation protein E (SpoIIE) [Listeria fleischmannii subsp. coloradonensis]